MSIDARLAQIERELDESKRLVKQTQSRLVYVSCIVAVVALLTGVWYAQLPALTSRASDSTEPADAISVRELRIIDTDGQTRIVLDREGLFLKDAQGKVRLGLGTIKDDPFLQMTGSNGIPRLAVSVLTDVPKISMANEHGQPRMTLWSSEVDSMIQFIGNDRKSGVVFGASKEGPQMYFRDTEGKSRFQIAMVNNDPNLYFWDNQSIARLQLGLKATGASIELSDEHGKERLKLLELLGGRGASLRMTGSNGIDQINLAVVSGKPLFSLNDEFGRLIWSPQ